MTRNPHAAFTRAGYRDGAERLKDMDADGVDVEVIYSEVSAFRYIGDMREGVGQATRAFNDVLSEFADNDRSRLVVSYQIPIVDIDEAVTEVKRVVALGGKSLQLPVFPTEIGMADYFDERYDPLWALIEETGLPICCHIGLNTNLDDLTRRDPTPQKGVMVPMAALSTAEAFGMWLLTGVLVRFPRLKLVFVEPGLGWIPWYLHTVDDLVQRQGYVFDQITELPSYYFHRNINVTFIDEPDALSLLRHQLGVENILWSTDFPHPVTSWPDSQQLITRAFDRDPDRRARPDPVRQRRADLVAVISPTTRTNWGRWGADDERGALNLIGSEQLLGAAAAVRRGKSYSLAMPIARETIPQVNNRPLPERLTFTAAADAPMLEQYGAAPGVGANEDVVIVATHAGTHMDALCHVFAEGTIYNGHPAESFTPRGGATRCSIERTGSFAARAVLLDVEAHTGGLEPGQPIGGDLLADCAAAEGVEVRPGDALLVRTGWAERWVAGDRDSYAQAGIDLDAVEFIADHDVAVVGCDNSAIECIPFDRDIFLCVHIALLQQLGVSLLEHLWLAELSADHAYEFMFCVGALPIVGAAGSPINPIAIA